MLALLTLLALPVAFAAPPAPPTYEDPALSLTGDAAGDSFGEALRGAGDIDGDGHADVIIGAPAFPSGTGYARVLVGSDDGLDTSAWTDLSDGTSSTSFGAAVDGAGDVDGDGYDDVVVGAPYSSRAESFSGTVYLFHGGPDGLDTAPGAFANGAAAYDQLGTAVAGAGDIDGDGYDDVVAGAVGRTTYTGVVGLYYGGADGLDVAGASEISGASAITAYFGGAVDGAGDVDGDGFDDLIVGALNGASAAGEAYLFLGSADGLEAPEASYLVGTASGGSFGYSVCGAGDLNADGYGDVVVGAPMLGASSGSIHVYLGSADGIPEDEYDVVSEPTASAYLGWSLGCGEDLNVDGYDDLAVSAHGVGTGTVRVILGSSDGLASEADQSLVGEDTDDRLGYAVASVGDVDANGWPDLLLGTPYNASYMGAARLYLGAPEDDDDDGFSSSEDCDDQDASVYPGATEVDGDGVDQDCDGQERCWPDADGDGARASEPLVSLDADCEDAGEAGSEAPEDCDDDDPRAVPGAEESCDGVDNDCDGLVPEDELDADADGLSTCDGDCDDGDGGVSPLAEEIAGDGVDQDCNGLDERAPAGEGEGEGETGELKDGGCGCASGGAGGALAGVGAALALTLRRRNKYI